jgi:outer membrane protein TolC
MNDLSPRNQLRHKRISFACPAVAYFLAGLLSLCQPAWGQSLTLAPAPVPQSSSSSNSGNQSSNSQTSNPGAALSQSPFSGSIPEGKATGEILPLSFKDAVDRGLRNNLGLLLQSDTSLTAQGEKWKELSELLPHVNAIVNQSVEQIDLAAFGFRFNFPGIPNVVGPIGVFQTGAYLTQSVFDYHAIERKRGASYNERAAQYSLKNARDLVVLAVGNSYLVTLSGAARVATAQADVETAQALYDKAADQQKAGVIPAIDALRAHVELQSRQQDLIVARNDYAKQKLTLGRVIGLPPGQEFNLTTAAPYEPLATLPLEQDLQRAYASRPDYLAAAQQVRSAEEFRRAATAEYYPSLEIAGNYGAAGIRPGSSHGVFDVGATLDIPIFAGGRTHADVLEAESTLRQSRQQLENLRGQIDYEVRSARLDLNSAAEQVEVAKSSVDLAKQTLEQAQDRFTAGVTDNLEVVQAQDSLTSANETYISALYSHNLAKIELAKAVGVAEEGVKQYLQNQK